MAETEVHKLGPKDWDPHTDRCLCAKNDLPLLSREEKADLRMLERMEGAAGRPGDFASLVGRVCATVRRLARLTPLDFDFPKYAGYVNRIAENVIAVRLAEKLLIENAMTVSGNVDRAVIMNHDVGCGQTEAIACVRPYVRITEPLSEVMAEALRSARMRMDVDGEFVVREAPLEEYLIGTDGQGFRRRPSAFTFARMSCLFRASYLRGTPVVSSYLDVKAQSLEEFGFMFPNGTRIRIELICNGPLPPVALKTGLVAALYTAKL